ncbi:MAG: hypothetical protein DRQ40_05340 [Gammaproteobacteria bacterium]|nr:MAG: hypothetical protein DRQ40_05340 [Gammaproteobacteria bacterium]
MSDCDEGDVGYVGGGAPYDGHDECRARLRKSEAKTEEVYRDRLRNSEFKVEEAREEAKKAGRERDAVCAENAVWLRLLDSLAATDGLFKVAALPRVQRMLAAFELAEAAVSESDYVYATKRDAYILARKAVAEEK